MHWEEDVGNERKRTLTIIDTENHLREIILDDFGKEFLHIGRNHCDITISDKIISNLHGTFWLGENQIKYLDENSSNGTFWENGGRRRLLSGLDGYVQIFDKTILRIGNIHDPGKMVLLLFQTAPEAVKWNVFKLEQDEVKIGRSTENDIVLSHPAVSRHHCRIQRNHQGKICLYDCSSANGVMINGKHVSEPTMLQDKDVIQILDFALLYSSECIYYRSVTEGISLRACSVTKNVGRGKKKKKILDNVSCEISPNEFVAIIGGSGAGKTTLMNAISGFEKDFKGNVYCNGIDLIEQFDNLKSVIGFVPQQDIIYENLTLRRMLYYTARLKMPADVRKEEINKRIDEVLEMVELTEHQNTYNRKLSGGQKKRASIAVELLADPKLFFLDEPTSGLDPGIEKNLMLTLNRLAKQQNKTVIMVTHTTQNLHLCDKVIFMGPGGRLCFCGNVNSAKHFFNTDDLVNIYNMISEAPEYWQKRFKERYASDSEQQSVNSRKKILPQRKESFWRQLCILTGRYAELMLNDKARLLVLILQPFLIAVLLKIVSDENVFEIYESTKSILFALSCSGIWIGLFNSIQEICKERVILKREYMANLKLPCYLMSKFVIQALLGLVQAIILTMVFLRLSGVSREGIFLEHFEAEILLTVWLTILASTAMGFIVSSIVKTGDKAMAIAPFLLIIQLLFSGILFKLEGSGRMISFCTISRWSVESLGSIAKLNRLDLEMQTDFPMLEHEAEEFFKASQGHLLQTWGILLLMTVFLMTVSLVMLRNVSRDHR